MTSTGTEGNINGEQIEIFEPSSLEKELAKYNLTPTEFRQVMKGLNKPSTNHKYEKKLPITTKRTKYMMISDTHIGHKNFREDAWEDVVKMSKYVEFITFSGDILEGMSGRDGHIYELDYIGATAQMDKAVELLDQISCPIYGITATDSHDGWFSTKGNTGFEVGPELDRRVKNFEFVGYDVADVTFANGMRHRMVHPGGGTAYAISYKMQKYINSITGGDKPHVMQQGHYHKLEYLFYRNIHGFDSGCLQDQTIFMQKKGTPAMVGYIINDVVFNKQKNEVDRLRPEFRVFY